MMVVLTEEFSNTELKFWAFNLGKALKRLNAKDISLVSRGKRELNYIIKSKNRGNFIQVNFDILPDYIKQLSKDLTSDTNVLRFLVFNINNSQK